MKATVFEYLFNKVGAATLFERCSSTGASKLPDLSVQNQFNPYL